MKPDSSPRVAVIAGGIAGLATALNLRDQAKAADLDLQVTVFEKGPAPGGNLQTIRRDGWQLEWGPNGFLDNEPATLRLVDRLGIRDKLQRSSDATAHRFLLVDGRIQEIPVSPRAFLKSGMMSTAAKLRMAGELFVPRRRDLGRAAEDPATDETIDQFGTRRLGRTFADVMLDPMVKGVFGGEAKKLSLAAAFPRMVELEKDYGGLFKAMMKLARDKKKQGKSKTDAGPSGVLHSFTGGMASLIDALAADLDADSQAEIRTGADVQKVTPGEDGWTVDTADGRHGPFDAVVQAAPAHAAARHLGHLDPAFADHLAAIPFAPMAVIALGFRRGSVVHDLNGFGMLVPSKEKRELLGVLWTSSIFPGRAPDGQVLLRCMAGGSGNPGFMEQTEDDMVGVILSELRPLMGLKGAPDMIKVIRHDKAIAQYVPGHLARLKEIDSAAGRYPGLFFTGSSYRGISVNACVKEAETVAGDVLQGLAAKHGHAQTEAL
ncbi:MAG: protoporphyrinogen oxidase [Candidatus Krumholzibacteriota bacterium]